MDSLSLGVKTPFLVEVKNALDRCGHRVPPSQLRTVRIMPLKGVRDRSDSVHDLRRTQWAISVGIGGRLGSDYADGFALLGKNGAWSFWSIVRGLSA
jgi:hypothetical protein